LDLGGNVVGAECVEFKPVENPKVFGEESGLHPDSSDFFSRKAGSSAPLGAREEVTEITILYILAKLIYLLEGLKGERNRNKK
jgi:hypothetical protein